MSKFNKIRAEMKKLPDCAEKKIIMTMLNDIEEQLNAFHFGLSGTLGYTYDTENFTKNVRPIP
jgi:hypothetical protein